MSLERCMDFSNTFLESSSIFLKKTVDNQALDHNDMTARECALEVISSKLQQNAINDITQSTMNWVNSGFDGRPAYVTNPFSVLRTTKEQVVDSVIFGDHLYYIDPDQELDLKFAINQHFFGRQQVGELSYRPKLDREITLNEQGTRELFSWSNILENNLNPHNNIMFNYFNLIDDIGNVIQTRSSVIEGEIRQSDGFLSVRHCEPGWEWDGSPESAKRCKITTPGNIISEKVSRVVNSDIDRVLFADDTDELMLALSNNIFGQALSTGGLASISRTDFLSSSFNNPEIFILEKQRLLLQYDKRVYEIAIRILESKKRTLLNARGIIQSTLNSWSEKLGRNYYKHISGYTYELLTQSTINTHISTIRNLNLFTKIDKNIQEIDEQIFFLEREKKQAENIRKLINNAQSYSELYSIIASNDKVEGIFLDIFIKSREALENEYNSIINRSTGGIESSREHNRSFNLTSVPEPDDEDDEVTIINSKNTFFVGLHSPVSFKDKIYTDMKKEIDDLRKNLNKNIQDIRKEEDGQIEKEQYQSLISIKTPSNIGSENIINFSEFFRKEEKLKFPNNQEYLSFAKKTEYGSVYFNSFLIDKRVTYKDGIGSKFVNRLAGSGRYCTKDGWNRFKVFIPPDAKKVALLFRPDRDVLHRVHLTYSSVDSPIENINHRDVKTLYYSYLAPNTDFFGLKDLFEKGNTVLLNIKYKGNFLTERGVGISPAGIVIGKEKLDKFIDGNGGWLYIDIAQDLNAAGIKTYDKNNRVEIFYYLDINENSIRYKNWLENIDSFIKNKYINIINKNC